MRLAEDKMINMQEQINIFKTKLKSRYSDLRIGYSYDEEEDYYDIWHTNSQLQFEDAVFRAFAGGLIKECFYSNDIFNFSFGYDYVEDEKSKLNYEINVYQEELYKKINLIFTKNHSQLESPFYDTKEKYCSSNWSKLDALNIVFDNLDISFFNQSVRQADLLVKPVVNLVDQTEKVFAA